LEADDYGATPGWSSHAVFRFGAGHVLLWSMQGGLKNLSDSIKAFSETDFHRISENSTCPRWSCMVKTTKSCDQYFRKKNRLSSSREAKELFYPDYRMASPHEMQIKSMPTSEICEVSPTSWQGSSLSPSQVA